METSPGTNIALYYDDDAFVEPPRRAQGERPRGLMGRQVAGRAFLDAYQSHGSWSDLVVLCRRRDRAESLVRFFRDHPSSRHRRRRLRIVEERQFHEAFFPEPPARLLHLPHPVDSKYAWARQQGGPSAFALCGVTHTLASAGAISLLRELVTAPFEPFDALICTSRAVAAMVRTVTGAYADYLRDRHGGAPSPRIRLETIPLGVDPEGYRPATVDERWLQRQALGIADDEVSVLFVGRLSHHAKAHPFPIFRGLAEATRATGQKVHLTLAGWAASPVVLRAFAEGAERFAPGVRVAIVDGTDPALRWAVWRAADVFASPSDNIQETFGLAVVEAMACGLPVIASDWDGYRDLVADGETGFLVPTVTVAGATAATTARLLLGEVSYDHFLAECSQAVSVDVAAMASAFARVIADAPLRRQMGEAGRRRVVERFTWERVVRSYEALWREQEAERAAAANRSALRPDGPVPAAYPEPDHAFAGYPTARLGDADQLQSVAGADAELPRLLATPLVTHAAERRIGDAAILVAVLEAAAHPRAIADLDALLTAAGATPRAARATLAWMLKYDLLRRA